MKQTMIKMKFPKPNGKKDNRLIIYVIPLFLLELGNGGNDIK